MRVQLLLGMGLIFISLITGMISSYGNSVVATVSPIPTSTYIVAYPRDLVVFPGDLVCDEMELAEPQDGPNWLGIKIGNSTLADLTELVDVLSDTYIWSERDNFDDRFLIEDNNALYSIIRYCTVDDVIQALKVSYNHSRLDQKSYLIELVEKFGIPDAVTWTSDPSGRIVIWFEDGIAATVLVLPDEEGYLPSFGMVTSLTFFPYQDVDGYEDRWPFNQTRPYNPYLVWPYNDHDEFGPESPFDFHAMIATMTAQPSRTPTLTPTPSATVIPATATPHS